MAKKKEIKKRPENYEKSNLKINGTFEQVISASFLGKLKEKSKENGGAGSSGGG